MNKERKLPRHKRKPKRGWNEKIKEAKEMLKYMPCPMGLLLRANAVRLEPFNNEREDSLKIIGFNDLGFDLIVCVVDTARDIARVKNALAYTVASGDRSRNDWKWVNSVLFVAAYEAVERTRGLRSPSAVLLDLRRYKNHCIEEIMI